MRKLVAALATGIIIATTAVTTVSAEEYEVQAGDNLWDIANENNTSVDELKDINDLNSTVIHPKQVLLLNEVYTVRRGDSLISIAEEYDVTVDELKKWNNLKSDIIIIGQDIEIKGVTVEKTENNSKTVSKQPSEKKEEINEAHEEVKAESSSNEEPDGKKMTVTATAYTASCEGCSGVTYTGVDLNNNPNAKVIAVDPGVIPLGSEVYVEGYGYATAADIGSAIQGKKIDVFISELNEAQAWGTRELEITVLN